jgi:hypothetical protein
VSTIERNQAEFETFLTGHAPDCWLAAAIRDAEREKG